MSRRPPTLALVAAWLVLSSLAACRAPAFLDVGPCEDTFAAAAIATCAVPGHPDRDYDLVLPTGYDGESAVPVLIAIHGGGGHKESMAKTTCSTGSVDDESCLHRHAQANGYALVMPDGTSDPLLENTRTWNAGGGVDGWRCTSGHACEIGVDDIAYFDALLDDLEARVNVDTGRVYATGLSNGGAMSHRLACELSDRIVAIAPVGGAMQLTTSHPCDPPEPVAVLHVHGTDDPCWRYDGGAPDCPTGQGGLDHVSVSRTMDEWSARLGCDPAPTEEALPDASEDGTTTTRVVHHGCDASLEHLVIQDGGHTWPDGFQYLGEWLIGPTPRDWGNEVIWDFLSRHAR